MVGLFAVIGFYAHVFMESSCCFEKVEDYSYSLGDLCISAICAFIALGIMAYLCIYQGMYQRREQFVVWAIRKKYYGENYNNPKLFPDNYKPFGKEGIEIVQGLYGEFVKIIIFVSICLVFSSLIKLVINIIEFHNNGCNINGLGLCIAALLVLVAVVWMCRNCFKKGKTKWKELSEEYKQYQ